VVREAHLLITPETSADTRIKVLNTITRIPVDQRSQFVLLIRGFMNGRLSRAIA